MKHKQIMEIVGGACALFLLGACAKGTDALGEADGRGGLPRTVPYDEITVVGDRLDFATTEAFQGTMEALDEALAQSAVATRSAAYGYGTLDIPGFTSLASRRSAVAREVTRAQRGEGEVTQEEYQLAKVSRLLVVPALSHVMDTSLTIGVEGRVYKVTDYGTFSVDAKDTAMLPGLIARFDTTRIANLEAGETVPLGNNATFTNSFGRGAVQDGVGLVEVSTGETATRGGMATRAVLPVESLHAPYGCATYTWANRSLFQKACDALFGKDVVRENYFDDNHRVRVRLYNVNYFFFAQSGISCTVQHKRRFLGIPYWDEFYYGHDDYEGEIEDIVIGFDKLVGKLTYNSPQNFSLIEPSVSAALGHCMGALNNVVVNFVYGLLPVNNLVGLIKSFGGELVFLQISPGSSFSKEKAEKIYNMAIDEGFKQLKGLTGKTVTNPLNKAIQKEVKPEDPRVGYFPWGVASASKGVKDFVSGVKHFRVQSPQPGTFICSHQAEIIFDTSFGIRIGITNGNFGLSSFSGVIFSKYDIEEVDGFAAAKYQGKWVGIRFVSPEK